MLTLAEAREVLGEDAGSLTDEEIMSLAAVCDLIAEDVLEKMETEAAEETEGRDGR